MYHGSVPVKHSLSASEIYVIAFLKSKGITIDVESVDAMIEAAGYELTNGFIKVEEAVQVVE